MKHADAWAALDHYDLRRVADDHGERRTLPESPAPVHALFRPAPTRTGWRERRWEEYRGRKPVFLDRYAYEGAACGKWVKVVLAVRFDDEEPDACPGCVAEAARRAEAPEAWEKEHRRRQDARRERQDEREREEEDIALWNRRQWDQRVMEELERRSDLPG